MKQIILHGSNIKFYILCVLFTAMPDIPSRKKRAASWPRDIVENRFGAKKLKSNFTIDLDHCFGCWRYDKVHIFRTSGDCTIKCFECQQPFIGSLKEEHVILMDPVPAFVVQMQ